MCPIVGHRIQFYQQYLALFQMFIDLVLITLVDHRLHEQLQIFHENDGTRSASSSSSSIQCTRLLFERESTEFARGFSRVPTSYDCNTSTLFEGTPFLALVDFVRFNILSSSRRQELRFGDGGVGTRFDCIGNDRRLGRWISSFVGLSAKGVGGRRGKSITAS